MAIPPPELLQRLWEAYEQEAKKMRYRLLDMMTGQQHGPLFTTHGEAERFGQKEYLITGQLFFLESFDPFTHTYDGERIKPFIDSEKAPEMTDEIPKHELLIKLMGKATSENDHEALAFLRKANSLIRESGWTWEQILRGKIKVVENPFKNLRDPSEGQRRPPAPPRPNPPADTWSFADGEVRPKPSPKPSPEPPKPPPPPPPPPPRSRQTAYEAPRPLSRITNNFGGYCFQCGIRVQPQSGVVFEPSSYNHKAPQGFRLLCPSCNQWGLKVRDYAATKKQGKASTSGPAPSVNDL